jgi:hypothetical protein
LRLAADEPAVLNLVAPQGAATKFTLHVLYGTTYSEYAKFLSAPPLFLEDENIFQKSARVVQIIWQFPIVPREPIFELHLKKQSVFFHTDSQADR